MPISDAVLRRRQLDLDRRTAELNEYFDLQTFDAIKRMPQYWRQLDRDITGKVASLYKKMGATTDPNKLKALIGKMDRLDAYAAQIRADIDRHTYGFETWTTGKLKQHFEKAYYMNGWAVEQAAKVTANIPVLSPAQVLGVLVNPWLPDGHTYSRRIRANADLLAYEMRGIMEDAVKMGTGWNEVARNISKKTGENYFRAVRLARTEMTRAQALGASYSYLQNNDILDGKRWNATLDSRTAAKDAANDGEVFDLDYDTVEVPGVPGKRIPNHPHCRCIWSPVLSALGVNDRERIARGDGDTTTHFGERIYTPARTYREYAKLRGMPDLDERLENDILSKYLRPGETIDDLNKIVKRFTLGAVTITVPAPYWETPKKAKKIPKPTKKETQAQAIAAIPEPQPANKVLPPAVQKIVDATKRYAGKSLTNDQRREYAKELLATFGLDTKAKVGIKSLKNAYGNCLYYTHTGKIDLTEYNLLSTDNRSKEYKIKTALHELFHASNDDLVHDFEVSSRQYGVGAYQWKFSNWTDLEETFTESAAHYLARESGIVDLQPSYAEKLVRNLPQLKQIDMFKNCETVEDFGEIMVQYRMVDRKPAYWRTIYQETLQANGGTFKPAKYAKDNGYSKYILENLDSLMDKFFENAPTWEPYRDMVTQQAREVWEGVEDHGGIPLVGNNTLMFNELMVAAMKRLGVK